MEEEEEIKIVDAKEEKKTSMSTDQEQSFSWGENVQNYFETREMQWESLKEIPAWSNDSFHFL